VWQLQQREGQQFGSAAGEVVQEVSTDLLGQAILWVTVSHTDFSQFNYITHVCTKMVCCQCTYHFAHNCVDQQILKPDDDYVLPQQPLWTFDVLVCPLSVTERFLSQLLVCGTVYYRTSLLPPLSIFCCRLKSHLFSLSYPAFWLFSHLYSAQAVTRHFGHYNRYYI